MKTSGLETADFERVACNYCGSWDHSFLFEISESSDERQPPAWRGTARIPVVRCRQCGLVFLNPRYSEKKLYDLYQDAGMFTSTVDPEGNSRSIIGERAKRVAAFQDEVRALRKFVSRGRLLDIGCGLGFFLETAAACYEVTGLEWSHPTVKLASGMPFHVVEAHYPEHPFSENHFDAVTFYNVLDHLPDPRAALQTAYGLLKPGGVLAAVVINFGSIASQIYGPRFRLLGPNHLYYFTPATLGRYLTETGFRVLQVQFPYFGMKLAKPIRHFMNIVRDWCALRWSNKNDHRVSPPFYGNIMRVFAVRPK